MIQRRDQQKKKKQEQRLFSLRTKTTAEKLKLYNLFSRRALNQGTMATVEIIQTLMVVN